MTETLKWHPSKSGICKSYDLPGGLAFTAISPRNTKGDVWTLFVHVNGETATTFFCTTLTSAKSKSARCLRNINNGADPARCLHRPQNPDLA